MNLLQDKDKITVITEQCYKVYCDCRTFNDSNKLYDLIDIILNDEYIKNKSIKDDVF